jgi:Phospholipase_D-nuclease N-terminal
MADLIPLIVLVGLGIMVAAMYDCVTTDPADVRNLPRIGWILVILLLPGVGGAIWYMAGRPLPAPDEMMHPAGQRIAPQDTDTEEMPRQSERFVAPDDDPDFIRALAEKVRHANEQRFRSDAEIRRRDDRAHGTEDGRSGDRSRRDKNRRQRKNDRRRGDDLPDA